MLSVQDRAIIKSTVPLLESGGEALITHFYRMMLSEYPEVRPLFNQAHQASGDQPWALANGVLMYARHIDQLDQLGDLVAKIINKHVALQILPEHYPIVGTCLLRAISEVLGSEIATQEVIDAWAAAYNQLADILIGAEGAIYDQKAQAPGGWRGAREFKLVRKVQESAEITSLYFEPADQGRSSPPSRASTSACSCSSMARKFAAITRCRRCPTRASTASASSARPVAWLPTTCMTNARWAVASCCSRLPGSSPSRPATSRWC